MSYNIKIIPSSSLLEFTGSDDLIPNINVSGSALNFTRLTPTQNDIVDVLQINRKHPTEMTPGADTSIGIAYYGKANTNSGLLFAKDIYTIQNTGSFGTDSVIVYKKSLYNFSGNILIEKKAPGIHEEFILVDGGVNNERFTRRTYMMTGGTAGGNQNAFLFLNHNIVKNISWIELNQNESAQINVRVIARAGGTGVRSRSFVINGYADTLDVNGSIAGNYAILNSTGAAQTEPPAGWNVQLIFENNFGGNPTNYIRVQVFNNTVINETITWTAYVELVVNSSLGTARYGI